MQVHDSHWKSQFFQGGNVKLQEQVCNIELAKMLKALGMKQESHFFWYERENYPSMPIDPILISSMKNIGNDFTKGPSAFTVAELGEMMFPNDELFFKLPWRQANNLWFSEYFPRVGDFTEADARAKMLIHLIEKGIVKP